MSKRREQRQRAFTNRREVESAAERIIPDDFVERYDGGETVAETLAYAHRQADTTTPELELPRCRKCSSVRITPTPRHDARADYVCTVCRWHGDEPARPGELVDDEVSAAVRAFDVPCALCSWRAIAYLSADDIGAAVCRRPLGELAAAIEAAAWGSGHA